ncbi:hypothetical protein [Mobilicoccus pelagius]|uniref:EccD-like transmembrane domain-containing protein n=1 Tax=Mobilicoccus pelagius NBRC 104925 TaxID=1089455 RepID=H5UPZ5_9MICO|nr:hypothetical protein [Mobilicoccus pelagius]GAB47800.1 hypothetical protein MOPEL_029_00810 [Mobilicoccus pelagius NBRC 104925]
MTASIRRVVRLTVLLPDDRVDVAVADDAVGAEVVRVARAASRTPVGGGDVDGWVLLHPTAGPIPLDATLQESLGRGRGPADGEVLTLAPRGAADTAPPVDDVAEHSAALLTPRGEPLGPRLAATIAVLVPVVAGGVAWANGRDVRAVAVAGLLIALATALWGRLRPETGVVAVPVVGVMGAAGALAASGTGPTWALVAACGALVLCGVLLLPTEPRLRPWLLAATATGALAGTAALGDAVLPRPGGLAPAALAAALLVTTATRISLTTSGLGRLDDRVARGEYVGEAGVTAAVARASDDLAALLWPASTAAVLLAAPLAATGRWGLCTALALALVVGTGARSMMRPRHVTPLVLGGGLAAVAVAMWGMGEASPRAIPAAVTALAVLVGIGGAGAGAGLHPVTVSRLRQAADVVGKAAVLAVPLLVLGVYDLYRVVWSASPF